jgi:subtilisin-like proprotein convertase family protein
MNRSLFFRTLGENWQERLFGEKRRGKSAGHGRGRAGNRPRVEQLEDRTLLSVLPAITPTGVVNIGQGNTPSIAYDPLAPQDMVAVFSTPGGTQLIGEFSTDGGHTWNPLLNPNGVLSDGTFAFATDASVAFDRNHHAFVLFSEENDVANPGTVLSLQKYDFSTATPTQLLANALSQWTGTTPVLDPTMAIDTNLRSFSDPITHATITDPFVDPVTGEGPLYIAWGQAGTNQIQLIGSIDGGVTFSGQITVNDPIHTTNAMPKLVVAQGVSSDHPGGGVQGGELSIVWNDFSNNTLLTDRITTGVGWQVFDGTVGNIQDATSGGAGNPDMPVETDFTNDVNITDPTLKILGDLKVSIALVHPHLNQLKIVLTAPNGLGSITLFNNGVDESGNSTGLGLPDVANLGVSNGQPLGTVFDDKAQQAITAGTAPYIGHFQIENFSIPSNSLNSLVQGLTPADVQGQWQLAITDYRNDGAPPTQSMVAWSLGFNTPGEDRSVFTASFATNNPGKAVVPGAPTGPYKTLPLAMPDRGVGPGLSLAIDNTLGSLSPFQGRIYAAYTAVDPNDANNTNVFLVTSDDGGLTWTPPSQINDDSQSDGFSGGNRSQFEPNLAVDPLTGTLVTSFYDARNDASNARVATYVATSIDGGASFSPETFLNTPRSALDAITGNTVQMEPTPDNSSAGNGTRDTVFGFGDRQSLSVYGGHVVAAWAGDQNSGTQSIEVGQGTIAAGPRVISSTMGPVAGTGINTTIAPDGTLLANTFKIQFDRLVDPTSFGKDQVQVNFRSPSTPASSPGTFLDIVSVTPLDAGPFGASLYQVVFDPAKAKSATGSYTGTYSYAIGPAINDGIRHADGTLGNEMDQNANGTVGEATDAYAAPTPLSGVPFQLPYDPTTLPLIVPGPHVIKTQVPGNPASSDNLVLNGTVSSIDVTFDRDMNAATFTPASINHIYGPAGPISGPFTVSANPFNIPGDLRTFRIGFPTQKLSGTYTILFGPNIQSMSGDAMDINQNAGLDTLRGGNLAGSPTFIVTSLVQSGGLATATTATANGFVTGDQVTISGANEAPYNGTFTVNVVSPRVFTYTVTGNPPSPASGNAITVSKNTVAVSAAYGGAPVTLSPGKTATIPLTFGSNFLIQGASILLNINYPHDPDLEATLVAPDGTRIKLFTNVGNNGSKANFANTVLTDLALTPIQLGVAPFNGQFDPQEPLATLTGKASAGVYKLLIKNDSVGTSGSLTGWSLSLLQSLPGTGLGEQVADQATATFRIFTMDPTNPVSHNAWTAVGPASITDPSTNIQNNNSGRIGGLAVDPSDPTGNTVYVAGASGGVWKTTNFLTTDPQGPIYTPLTDFGPAFAINIGSIAVFGRNNDTNQSIIIAGTGEGDIAAPGQTDGMGVGFIRSMDGGATWTLLDSSTNVDSSGKELPINSTLRDHIFVGTATFKVIADPVASPGGKVILFAALTGTEGGIWRSLDSGDHWTQVLAGDATDVAYSAGSASTTTGNLQILYAAIRGTGVLMSQNQGSSFTIMNGGIGNPLIRNADTTGIAVTNPTATPNGAKGRIVLATPSLTGSRAQDLGYEGWLYAAVVTSGGTFDGLYVTKDFGQNWTLIPIPVLGGLFPTNDETQPTVDILSGQGNYDIDLAIDPVNPNILYMGGSRDASPFSFIRIDTTRIIDPKNVSSFDNSNNDTGLLQSATTGSISSTLPTGLLLTDPFTGSKFIQPTINALRDPFQPFLANATLVAGSPPISAQGIPADVTGAWTNSGQDVRWSPFDKNFDSTLNQYVPNHSINGTTDHHRVLAVRDPLTGKTRLIFGDDQGVFTALDQGDGQLLENLGGQSTGTIPVPTGSRNGNLQITQFYSGAVQPSILAAQVGQALFYGNAQDDGFPVSQPDLLTTGNIKWTGPQGDGAGIATDATGTGTVYTYQWPCCGTHSQPTDFFSVNPNGAFDPKTGNFASRTFGLIQSNVPGTPDPQWPPEGQAFDNNVINSSPAVNPINGNQLLISSVAGRVFRTSDQGLAWFEVGFVAGDPGATPANTLDGTYAPALAYGAPDPANLTGNLDDFFYVGTVSGNIFVSFDGGGSYTNISSGLDGSKVMSIVTNPIRGSHEAYAVTLNGVFHMTDSSSATATWQNITSNLFSLKQNSFGDSNLAAAKLAYLSSIVADWRFAIPNNAAKPNGATHPALYVGGQGGVFRSMDNGKTWTIFPDVAHDGAAAVGGYLPVAAVTGLALAAGAINPTTGQPDQSGGPNLLVATTYGRGVFAIRLPNNSAFNFVSGPRVVSVTPSTPTNSFSSITITFGSSVDPSTVSLADIVSFTGPGGAVITPTSIQDKTSVPPGTPNPHNIYEIDFPTQTALGIYKISIGPNITDFPGNQMNQNNNKVNGEIPTDEFTANFVINPSDNGFFVSGTFHDVLSRASDTQGFINSIAPIDATRLAQLPTFANHFVFSQEYFRDLVQRWYTKYLMRSTLPGASETDPWVTAMTNGMIDEQVIANLVGSTEYFGLHGSTNPGFLTGAYLDILGRDLALDPSGEAFYLNQLANGVSRTTVALELLTSGEYRRNLVSGYYSSFLGRTVSPSSTEVAGWVNAIANGMRDETVISNFISSQEYFQGSALGGDTNASWLTSLYGHPLILHRAPDTDGFNFNLNGLLNSYAVQRQAESAALLGTQEYRSNLVTGWFQKYLGRAPSSAELTKNTTQLAVGFTDEQVIANIVGSTEYFQNHGSTNLGFLQAAFNDILGRALDSSGQTYFLNQLAAGVTRATVALELLTSGEYRTNLVNGFYTNLLGRSASSTEVAGWVAALAGGETDEQVINAFLTTNEYFLRTHTYP